MTYPTFSRSLMITTPITSWPLCQRPNDGLCLVSGKHPLKQYYPIAPKGIIRIKSWYPSCPKGECQEKKGNFCHWLYVHLEPTTKQGPSTASNPHIRINNYLVLPFLQKILFSFTTIYKGVLIYPPTISLNVSQLRNTLKRVLLKEDS